MGNGLAVAISVYDAAVKSLIAGAIQLHVLHHAAHHCVGMAFFTKAFTGLTEPTGYVIGQMGDKAERADAHLPVEVAQGNEGGDSAEYAVTAVRSRS